MEQISGLRVLVAAFLSPLRGSDPFPLDPQLALAAFFRRFAAEHGVTSKLVCSAC
jgi:hypothetical protein